MTESRMRVIFLPSMDFLRTALDVFVHIDTHLTAVVQQYGTATYAVLFAVIFSETGFVVTPFLPGDSLLFAAGSIAALGVMNIVILYVLLLAAATLGNMLNYWIGFRFGAALVARADGRLLRREHLEKTQRFFAKHGAKTIVLSRFVPIVRTIAPFVAGVGRMPYATFAAYNFIGGFLWVTLFVWGGFLFGNVPWVRENFEYVILGIIATSFIPPILEFVRHHVRRPGADSGSITP